MARNPNHGLDGRRGWSTQPSAGFVNVAAVRAMSDEALGQLIADGGPLALIEAAYAEREHRASRAGASHQVASGPKRRQTITIVATPPEDPADGPGAITSGALTDAGWTVDDVTVTSQRFQIREAGPAGQIGGRVLATVVAEDGFEALNRYCDLDEMAGYVRAESDAEYARLMDEGDQIPASYSPAHGAWTGVYSNFEIAAVPVREYIARFDVTGLSEREVDALACYVETQAEGSDGDGDERLAYPSVNVVAETVPPFPPSTPRTILVHLNVELPADSEATTEDVEREIKAALDDARERVYSAGPGAAAPTLRTAEIVIPLAEEV